MFAQPPVVIVYIICTQKCYHNKSTRFSIIYYRMSIYHPKLNTAFTILSSAYLMLLPIISQ